MPNYVCHNPECPDAEEIIHVGRVTLRYASEGVIDSGIPCPKCGKDREALVAEGMTTVMTGSPNICRK